MRDREALAVGFGFVIALAATSGVLAYQGRLQEALGASYGALGLAIVLVFASNFDIGPKR